MITAVLAVVAEAVLSARSGASSPTIPSEDLAHLLNGWLWESKRHCEHGKEEENEIGDEGRSAHVELEKCPSIQKKSE
ncbi:hypothetical protein CTheo_4605 [Ceratobasidium theobromae]|uniref:Secreted protein n=1 Tax=Ceratobasidium theobromae TaxID=1582974 RepID=A0A5N5QKA8_9AGAM|nr:hypothetical protein CTheo_4605 [Ceratobasidium theobromae]